MLRLLLLVSLAVANHVHSAGDELQNEIEDCYVVSSPMFAAKAQPDATSFLVSDMDVLAKQPGRYILKEVVKCESTTGELQSFQVRL